VLQAVLKWNGLGSLSKKKHAGVVVEVGKWLNLSSGERASNRVSVVGEEWTLQAARQRESGT